MSERRGERSLLQLERDHLTPGAALSHRLAGQGAVESTARGAWVELDDGRRMLDLGSFGINLLGHRHPNVVAGVEHQLATMPASTRTLANPTTITLAARLSTSLGSPLQRCWFGSSGSEAVEAALKLARLATGRGRVFAVAGGFHGKTLGALAVTASPRYRNGLEPLLAPVVHLDPNCPDAVAEALRDGEPPAALLFEPVQGEGGVRPLDPTVLQRWSDDIHDAGGFVVADEVQCGFGRCAGLSVAVTWGIDVDAVLLGKALGGGIVPFSAVVGTDALFAPLLHDPFRHSSTFGGHPLGAAAALAALDVIEADGCAGDITATAGAVRTVLDELVDSQPDLFTSVRSTGLMLGIECRDAVVAGSFLLEVLAAGVIVSPCLGAPEVIRILPPLILDAADVATASGALWTAASKTAAFADDIDRPTPASPSASGPIPKRGT